MDFIRPFHVPTERNRHCIAHHRSRSWRRVCRCAFRHVYFCFAHTADIRMITLPFHALPGIPRLFSEYVTASDSACAYYMGHFSDLLAWETHIQSLERRSHPREALYSILTAQNKIFRAGNATWQNLELLRRPETFAVVTGQQVGIFGGPLYTLYKALTAVRLCDWLKQQFPGNNFVPIFWMECEDHDFAEINSTGIITAQNDFTRINYTELNEEDEKHFTPVGALRFDARIRDAIERMRQLLPVTEFSEALFNQLDNSYTEGEAPQVCFARYLNELYPGSGIIFLDPTDAEFKRMAAPVVLQELETWPTTGEEVIKRSAELDERYHAQIKPRAVNLFFLHKEKRYAIEPGEQGFFLKGARRRFTHEELIALAQESPELFSSNVLLRPIIQDSILPTVTYVGGPSEVSYFAQLQPAYDHFQIPMPIIMPRSSITILEQQIEKLFGKYALPYTAMFMDSDAMFRIATSATPDESTQMNFDSFSAAIDAALELFVERARTEHQNLADPAEATVRNIHRALNTFGDKLMQHRRQKDEVMTRQLTKMQSWLVPEGKPQERQVNALVFCNRYGPSFLSALHEACAPFPAEHRLLMLK
jgi:bacillithiol synthase